MHSNPLRILAGAVLVCCLAIGVAGSTTTDAPRATSVDANIDVESNLIDEPVLQQRQRSNASAAETDLRIDVRTNGSALWTVRYRFRLTDANETTAFDRLRTDIEANPDRYRDRFEQRMAEAVSSAENTTGREMAITNVSVRAARNGTTGVVAYEFVWQNFAASDGDRLRIDGALAGFAPDNRTQVTMSWADGYEPTTVRPTPTDRRSNAITWTGATEFTGGEPVVELVRADTTTGTTGTRTTGGAGGAGGADGADGADGGDGADGESTTGSDLPLSSIGMVALALLVGSLGLVWFVRRRQRDDTAASATSVADSGPSREPSTESAPTSSDGGSRSQTAEATGDRSALDLLSNEERVLEVLRRSDGRAKQQEIVDQLGWTDAKTSSVVSQLRDDGTIEGFRLGRENVLRLPDEDQENGTDTDGTPTDE